MAPGQLALRVNQVSTIKTRDTEVGPWSKTIVYFSLTLANGAGAADVPANAALFSVKADNGLAKIPTIDVPFVVDNSQYSAATFIQAPPCDPALSLSGGASLTCSLAISFDGDVTVNELKYRTPGALAVANGVAMDLADNRTASAAINANPCVPCGKICTDTASDAQNCGACKTAAPAGGTCVHGQGACPADRPGVCPVTTGTTACTQLATDSSNCGMCGKRVPSNAVCTGGKPTCMSPDFTYCPAADPGAPGTCSSLKLDPQNCGSCGVVAGDGTCTNGIITCNSDATMCGAVCIRDKTKENCGSCMIHCDRSPSDSCAPGIEVQPVCSTAVSCSTLLSGGTKNYNDGCKRLGYSGCVFARTDTCQSSGPTCFCAY